MNNKKMLFAVLSLAGLALSGCGPSQVESKDTVVWYQEMPLISEGVHMKKGSHNYVITEQFYRLFTDDVLAQNQKMAINAFKEAYSNLDKYTKSLSFNLCTTVDEVASKYDIQKVDSVGEQDIALYIVDDNNAALAKASISYDSKSKQMKELSITFRKETVFSVWALYNNMSQLQDPYNTVAYTNAIRTGMETMGFAYFNDNQSVMNDLNDDSPKDFTQFDLDLLEKYEKVFYETN